MIFKVLDFHASEKRGQTNAVLRHFRLKMNYIVDSFSLRIPKKIKTLSFHKLNVCVHNERCQSEPFFALEGIGYAEIVDPDIDSIYEGTQAEIAKHVKVYLRRGIQSAAKHDALFARHMELWKRLLATTEEEFDYDYRVSRFHRSRLWRCEAVLRITPRAYHYDVLVKENKSQQTIQRHRIKTIECVLPLFEGIGLCKLRWEGSDVVGLSRDDKEVFRFDTKLPA
jgi:hypothetical protein